MKKIYSSDDPVLIGYLHQALANERIVCMQRNAFLSGGMGELPPNECWPELWVIDRNDSERACALIDALLQHEHLPLADWNCSHCGEHHSGQFTACWNCGAEQSPI